MHGTFFLPDESADCSSLSDPPISSLFLVAAGDEGKQEQEEPGAYL
jgi:hypothetical protein